MNALLERQRVVIEREQDLFAAPFPGRSAVPGKGRGRENGAGAKHPAVNHAVQWKILLILRPGFNWCFSRRPALDPAAARRTESDTAFLLLPEWRPSEPEKRRGRPQRKGRRRRYHT
jgi:hypothetical protein